MAEQPEHEIIKVEAVPEAPVALSEPVPDPVPENLAADIPETALEPFPAIVTEGDSEQMQVDPQPDAKVEPSSETAEQPKTTEAEPKPESTSQEAQDNKEKIEDVKDNSKDSEGSNKRERNRNNFSASERAQYKKNIKARFDNLPISCDPVEIRKQAEFYFSDSNLPMDKFLFAKVNGKENKPVDIKLISEFKRMRRFQPFEAIVAALKESTFLEVVDDDKVRRKVPLNVSTQSKDNIRVFEDQAMPKTIYAKGFGEETETTQLDIEKFFEPFGPVCSVRLRRTFPEKTFKGSVFVEFPTEEAANKFLETDPKPQWNGEDLLIMSKKAYCDMKIQDIKDGKIKANQKPYGKSKFQNGRGGGGRGRGGNRGRGGRGGHHGGHRDGGDNKRKRADDESTGNPAKKSQTIDKENAVRASA